MKKSQIDRAIESLEAERAVLDAAIAKLKQQAAQKPVKTRKPKRRECVGMTLPELVQSWRHLASLARETENKERALRNAAAAGTDVWWLHEVERRSWQATRVQLATCADQFEASLAEEAVKG